jgi:sigma-B regulation protein RsbU (phosphoserine phosphatase)
MFLSLCYAVVDKVARTLRWTNTGHPHAFVIGADGIAVRLEATDPPLGLGPEALHVHERPWDPAADLLVLFTDGVSDARDPRGAMLGEGRVLEVLRARRRGSWTGSSRWWKGTCAMRRQPTTRPWWC